MSHLTKKRCRNTRNLDDSARKLILDKRLASLCKQAEELSILCDIKVSVVAFSPEETKAFAWPYLTQANVTEKYIGKIEQTVEEKEMENLFNQLVEGKNFHELDSRETKGLLKLFDVKQTKLNERKTKLNEHIDGNALNQDGANDNNVGEENVGRP
ncbi:hypothetical protein R3W88_016339 [Solanum pinnatisectum]|uniref:MADS-box domain-containing protein n=1 Tax=Solanum pinnatisectum TaxID=50273 RepID=A0AAV9KX43_9SOLN|nr:hypothetical protein R3W88_016339 [Solanum pinnatisectum]